MSSFVYIELDTSPPQARIFAPSYTMADIKNKIRIESNEAISGYSELYVVDSNGTRHDYTFKKEEANLLIGEISFFGFPLGIVTINVRLEDEVGNKSDLISKTIEIKETISLLKLVIKDRIRELSIRENDKVISAKRSSAYQFGNVVRFGCEFYDLNNAKINPDFAKIILYNSRYEVLLEKIVDIPNRYNTGEYHFDYITENKSQLMYYEWYGEINGKPSLKRGQIKTNFM